MKRTTRITQSGMTSLIAKRLSFMRTTVLCISLALGFCPTVQAQKFIQEIKAFKIKTGIYLETKQTRKAESQDILLFPSDDLLPIINSSFNTPEERLYFVGLQHVNILKQGLKKILTWADLNRTHKKEFEKEVCRFRVMEKEEYRFHGYIPQITREVIVNFYGKDDGAFSCIFSFKEDRYELHFVNKVQVNDFLKLLNGQSVNKNIDNIFH